MQPLTIQKVMQNFSCTNISKNSSLELHMDEKDNMDDT
jgi:hypothetical protein